MDGFRRIGCIALLLVLAASAGCGVNTDGRQEISRGGKKITVLDTKTPLPVENTGQANAFDIEKIDRYEGIRGEDWLSDDSILVTRENSELEPISVGDQMSRIRNLYSYSLKSKEEKSIFQKTEFIWRSIVSPDRAHMFSVKFEPGRNTGLMSDLEGNIKAKLESDTAKGLGFSVNSARWVNNEEVIVPSLEDGVYFININSGVTKIQDVGRMQTDDAVKVGDKIYYVSVERKLMAYDINTRQRKAVKDDVLSFELSPKKDMFAVEKKVSADRDALVLTDLEGNEKTTLLEAKMIFGISWSPDQSKLAYIITSDDESKGGLYVMDLGSKKSLYVSRDFINVDNGLKWSPSGKKILASIGEDTYVVSLK